ncbi:MAG: acetoacetate metabolism regulatory protein AtoC [Planctomycetota bacterium]|nr:MAG: acetoacetate metabolism regulatory protein AtoC [Planctomycetota bacterium]
MTDEPLRVLLAEDEPNLRRLLAHELAAVGMSVEAAPRGDEALRLLCERPFDVVVLDLKMPGLHGMEVLREARRAGAGAEVIVLTGHGTIESVVEAMKLGAFDYLTKPCRLDELELLVRRAGARRRARAASLPAPPGSAAPVPPAPGPLRAGAAGGELLVLSEGMRRAVQIIDRAAPTDAPVLLEGESGTGKELLARRLHARSQRASGPLVVINCGALQPALLLSELFGHEKGAFTGAERRKRGLLELADGGTAFLDEIGELPLEGQVRLLRFLQFGELRRLGSEQTVQVRVRVVAATHRNLREEMQQGRFREDLFYRLHTIHVRVPPLRERPEEIPALLERFLERSPAGRGRSFEPEAVALLMRYPWPGNVRELENIVERLAILCEGTVITRQAVLDHFEGLRLLGTLEPPPEPGGLLRQMERREIIAALQRHRGNKVKAAAELGIALKTLYNKIKAYGIPT